LIASCNSSSVWSIALFSNDWSAYKLGSTRPTFCTSTSSWSYSWCCSTTGWSLLVSKVSSLSLCTTGSFICFILLLSNVLFLCGLSVTSRLEWSAASGILVLVSNWSSFYVSLWALNISDDFFLLDILLSLIILELSLLLDWDWLLDWDMVEMSF